MNAYTYSGIIGDTETEEVILSKLKKKYGKGKILMEELQTQFYEEKDLAKKASIYSQLKSKMYGGEDWDNYGPNMSRTLAYLHAAEGQYDKASSYMKSIDNPATLAGLYNQLAWPMSGESLEGEARDLATAKKYSAESIQIVESIIEDPTKGKPEFYTPAQWKRQMAFSKAMYADTYALLAYKSGEFEDALKYQKIASKIDDFNDGDMNYRYATYLEKVKGAEKAEVWMEKMIRRGVANEKMIARHKELFMANNTMETVYEKYIVELEKDARAKQLKDLKNKMIREPAPAYELVNLEGQPISSKDLKGKNHNC